MDETPILSAIVNKTVNKALFDTAVGRERSGRVIWASGGSSGDQSGEVHSGVNSGQFWVNSGPFLDPI